MEGENLTTGFRASADLIYRLGVPDARARKRPGRHNFKSRIVRSRRFSLGATSISKTPKRERRHSSTLDLSQLHLLDTPLA
jgi:hypothetical protein